MSHRVSAQAFFLRTPNSHRTTGHTCTNLRRVQQFIKAVLLLCTSSRRSSWLAATYWTPSRFRCSDTCSGTAAPVSTCFAPGFPLRATDTRSRRCSCHPWALGQAPMLFRTKHLHAFKPSVGNKHLQTSILAHSSTYACRVERHMRVCGQYSICSNQTLRWRAKPAPSTSSSPTKNRRQDVP